MLNSTLQQFVSLNPRDSHVLVLQVETASSPTAVTDLSQITLPNGPTTTTGGTPGPTTINTTPVREKKKAKRSLKISPNLAAAAAGGGKSPATRPLQLYQPPPPPPPPLETRSVEGEPSPRLPPSDGAEAEPPAVVQVSVASVVLLL